MAQPSNLLRFLVVLTLVVATLHGPFAIAKAKPVGTGALSFPASVLKDTASGFSPKAYVCPEELNSWSTMTCDLYKTDFTKSKVEVEKINASTVRVREGLFVVQVERTQFPRIFKIGGKDFDLASFKNAFDRGEAISARLPKTHASLMSFLIEDANAQKPGAEPVPTNHLNALAVIQRLIEFTNETESCETYAAFANKCGESADKLQAFFNHVVENNGLVQSNADITPYTKASTERSALTLLAMLHESLADLNEKMDATFIPHAQKNLPSCANGRELVKPIGECYADLRELKKQIKPGPNADQLLESLGQTMRDLEARGEGMQYSIDKMRGAAAGVK